MGVIASLKRLFAEPYNQVSAAQAAELISNGAVLVDVREPQEWHAGHAPKAQHIPLAQLPARVGELPADRPLITVCRSGARSARAAALLAGDGRQVSNLSGGMHAWKRQGLPLVAKGGGPGRVV